MHPKSPDPERLADALRTVRAAREAAKAAAADERLDVAVQCLELAVSLLHQQIDALSEPVTARCSGCGGPCRTDAEAEAAVCSACVAAAATLERRTSPSPGAGLCTACDRKIEPARLRAGQAMCSACADAAERRCPVVSPRTGKRCELPDNHHGDPHVAGNGGWYDSDYCGAVYPEPGPSTCPDCRDVVTAQEGRSSEKCDALRGLESWSPSCQLEAGHDGPHRWTTPATAQEGRS